MNTGRAREFPVFPCITLAGVDPYVIELRSRERLRRFGMLLYCIGGVLCGIGLASMFSSYIHILNDFETMAADEFGRLPKYAWMLYAGLPFLGVAFAIRVYVASRKFRDKQLGKTPPPIK